MASEDGQSMMDLLKEVAGDCGAGLEVNEREDGGFLVALAIGDVIEGFPLDAIGCHVEDEDGLEQAATWLLGQVALQGLDADIETASIWADHEDPDGEPCVFCGSSDDKPAIAPGKPVAGTGVDVTLLSVALRLSILSSDVGDGSVAAAGDLRKELDELSEILASAVKSGESAA